MEDNHYEFHRLFVSLISPPTPFHPKKKTNSFSMSTDPFQLYSPLHRSTRSANDIQVTPDFSWSLDDITSTTTSPLTPLDSSLWLPDDFSSGARNVAGPPTGLFSCDSGAYTQIQYKCQCLEYDLLKEKEDHVSAKVRVDVYVSSAELQYSPREKEGRRLRWKSSW